MRKYVAQQGMTLIELMVSMVIGLFLILGAVTVYTQGRQNYQINEGISRLQENLRFSLNVIEPDVRLSGYWGLNNRGQFVDTSAVAVICDGNDVSAWALDLGTAIEAVDNVQAADAGEVSNDCSAFGGGVVVDTDILILRHASGAGNVPLDNGTIQLQASVLDAVLFDDGNEPAVYSAFDPSEVVTHNLVINAWYISQDSNSMDGVPSLRRRTLVGDEMIDEEVIAGVENMQIQFGIDTDLVAGGTIGDGSVDRYVDAEDPLLIGNNILSMRIWMLIRSPEEERGFTEGRAGNWNGYIPLDSVLDPIVPDDSFRRMQASKTIFLRNFQRIQLGS
ncbi:MAG: prepilin-type N-terminal cleavage/methylation domain-containing protein [Gammaproteobacteria bacterium]|nr:prepilin-type N-terminal cleavage/methylation domain-containing protein [Gammaproteobacteria bacterium]